MVASRPALRDHPIMTDYWLSKLFYDLQAPAVGAKWREDRTAILDSYPLTPEMRQAVLDDDLAAMAPHVNAYLLRFYCAICGLNDAQFIERIRALKPQGETSHG